MMLQFDSNGFLMPYEAVPANLATIEAVFVHDFPESTTRRAHFARYLDYNARLRTYLPNGFTQWLDGSFVSRKLNPDDIDILTFVDYALYEQHEKALRALKEEVSTGVGRVDANHIRVYPEGHRHRFLFESDRVQWFFDWSQTIRKPRMKRGLIELNF